MALPVRNSRTDSDNTERATENPPGNGEGCGKSVEDFLAEGHTPMMAQYHAIKARYPDCILFYRMGDFYEMFHEDAVKAAAILDISLTKRGKNQGHDISMCGVPFHSYEPYLAKLIKAGQKVAICEQSETPEQAKKARGSKALVRREVVRVVTQGTLTEDSLLDANANNYLVAISEIGGKSAIAWLELSTGEFLVQKAEDRSCIPAALGRIEPSEIIVSEKFLQENQAGIDSGSGGLAQFKRVITVQPAKMFDSASGERLLKDVFRVSCLESIAPFDRCEIAAAACIVRYIERTQAGKIPRLSLPRQVVSDRFMEIDAATKRNLELTRSLSGGRKNSLLDAMDRTLTGGGARMLQRRISSPLCVPAEINKRLNEIEILVGERKLREKVRDILRMMPDMERAMARISVQRAVPRDLAAISGGLELAQDLRNLLLFNAGEGALADIAKRLAQSSRIREVADTLKAALRDDLPALLREGGFIKEGYDKRLDELRNLRDDSKQHIAALQAEYRSRTGIESLKVSYNRILGYFIDVPARRADSLMVRAGDDATNNNNPGGSNDNPFIHRQTLANSVRFTTPELSELERDLSGAAEKAVAIELQHFEDMSNMVNDVAEEIGGIARAVAAIDVAAGLAELAVECDYVRPMVDEGKDFEIVEGRHPVVESSLVQSSESFIPNDCKLGEDERIWILTGPNMAGKSTFLRQNALIAVMAQAGSFVPARSAHIGVIDKVFSRVGAADDLARGRSTFMVEMVETAAILNRATKKSFVILDEIGRGTATFDGLSIAWACVEHLHEHNMCRTIFATHYHELTSLATKLDSLGTYSMQVKEWKGDIVFLHSVRKGSANRSYGIHVAKLAGLPGEVVARASQILEMLNNSEKSSRLSNLAEALPLFAMQDNTAREESSEYNRLIEMLEKVKPDEMSPKDALDLVYEIKSMLEK